ncbi:MAG TPA: DUF3014 domain-containing protein [Myxococcaceae bacterium]
MSQQPMVPGSPTPGGPGNTPPPTQPRKRPVGLIVALVALVGAGIWYSVQRMKADQPPPPTPPAPELAKVVDAGTPPLPGPPSVAEGDARVRALVGPLSQDPDLAKWLTLEGLLQRFTTAVTNIADGESPRMVLSFLAPTEGFKVVETPLKGAKGKPAQEKITIDPQSYARYDTVARVLGSLDVTGVRYAWVELKPLVDRVYVEIAPPGRTFDQTLNQAIQSLLAVPVPQGDVEVVPKGGLYAFADPKLEGLNPAQKHLLRMGPQNMQIVQRRLTELHTALNLPAIDR